ncbi:MAG TPA: MATE family efflux transporter, partial [Chloroflexi bacterium]|nr:MATE family efflux transporter [Chloroflexota bacterium]
VATGTTALVAQAIGARNETYAARVLEQAVLIGLGLGFGSMALLMPLSRTSMVLMGAEPAAVEMGGIYLVCVSVTLPLMALLFIGNASLRGAGDTRTPMAVMGGLNLVNLVLSFVLIRGLGPIPALGVMGAGIAAATANGAGGLAVIIILRRGRANLLLKRVLSSPDREVLKQILNIGLPAGGETLLMRFAMTAYTRSIASLGTAAYAAHVIVQRIESMNTMPSFGFSTAATTLCGQNIGAGDPDRARRSVFSAMRIAFTFSLAWTIISILFPAALMGIFTSDKEVISLGITPMRILALAQPLMAITFSLSGGLRGAGDTRSVMWITGIGSWLVRVPIAVLAATRLNLGLAGVQSAMIFDWGVRLALLSWRFRPVAWARRMASKAKPAQPAVTG